MISLIQIYLSAKKFVDGAQSPVDKDQLFYRDDQLMGINIGKYGALTVEQEGSESNPLMSLYKRYIVHQ